MSFVSSSSPSSPLNTKRVSGEDTSEPVQTFLFGPYENWLRENAGWVSGIEDAARTAIMFMPGRYTSEELEGEAVYAGLNIISYYHDLILKRDRLTPADIRCGPENGYTTSAKALFTVCTLTEVLCEMAGRKYFPSTSPLIQTGVFRGLRGKWAIICGIEVVKVLCKLVLLRNNGGRMLVPLTREDMAKKKFRKDAKVLRLRREEMMNSSVRVEEEEEEREESRTSSTTTDGDKKESETNEKERRRRRDVRLVFQDVVDMYRLHGRGGGDGGHPHGNFSSYTNPARLIETEKELKLQYRSPSLSEKISEFLNTIRPAVYAAGLLYFPEGSWRPLLLSLLVDGVSKLLERSPQFFSTVMASESSRRRALMLFYFLRSPLFDTVTRVPIDLIFGLLAKLPLIGSSFQGILDLLFSLQTFHFYTSASS